MTSLTFCRKLTVTDKLEHSVAFHQWCYIDPSTNFIMGCCSSSADDVYEDNVIMVDKPSSESNPVVMLQKEEENPSAAADAVEAVVTLATVAVKTEEVNPNANRACFGAGCYWGTEKYFKYYFGKRNLRGRIKNAAVGFMGPTDAPDNPTYKEVCGGYTGDSPDAPPVL